MTMEFELNEVGDLGFGSWKNRRIKESKEIEQ